MNRLALNIIRESLGHTIENVAKHCGVSVNQMKEYEKNAGDIPASIVIKLRNLYGIPIDYIKI